jgi:hypothetical protein
MSDRLVKVHDVSQEYWYISRSACPCGGRYDIQRQVLKSRDGVAVDHVVTRCNGCGHSRDFIFDISAFFGGQRSSIAEAVQTIQSVIETKDQLALDWLEDAIRNAREKLSA